MAKSKRSGIWGRILRVLKFAVTLFVGLSIFGVILLRFVNPPFTWLMVLRGFERKSDGKDWKIDKKWISFDDIADPMKRAAVAAEDQTFLENHGFDFKAMEKPSTRTSTATNWWVAAPLPSKPLKTFSFGPGAISFAKPSRHGSLY